MAVPPSTISARSTVSARSICAQRIRAALAALQSMTIYHESLSPDSAYILRDMAESDEELGMEPDELARAIILRESGRLENLTPDDCQR